MTSNKMTQMDPDHVVHTLKFHCTNKQICPISGSRRTFGDVSEPDVAKFLRVWYECIPDHRQFLVKVRLRRDLGRSKEKREFFLPVIDKSPVKEEHSRDVSQVEKEWDKNNEQSNTTTDTMATKINKRQEPRRKGSKLSHMLSELLNHASL